MRNSKHTWLVAAAACLVLTSCGKKTPSGQVVATVGGQEVTSIDLNNELNGFQAPNPQIRKAAEQQALNNLLVRKTLARGAEKAGVAKTTVFAQQEERMRENLLIQSWQAQIAKMVPSPSKEEVDKFVTDHPDMFAQRKIFDVDQVKFPRAIDPNVVKQFGPVKTLPAITALLTANHIPFEQGHSQVDALALDPKILDQIVKLPPGEVFVMPASNLLIANQIQSSRVLPVSADDASKRASAIIKAQHTREAIQRQFGGVIAAAKKDIIYSKAYQPPAPPKAAPSGAPAAPAAKGN